MFNKTQIFDNTLEEMDEGLANHSIFLFVIDKPYFKRAGINVDLFVEMLARRGVREGFHFKRFESMLEYTVIFYRPDVSQEVVYNLEFRVHETDLTGFIGMGKEGIMV